MNFKFLGLFLIWSGGTQAAETVTAPQSYDLPKVVAVQNRAFRVDKDLSLQVGYLPSDAFNKGYVLGASYTHFFNDYFGWEVINANGVINDATNLKSDLLNCCGVDVENNGFGGALDYMDFYALTSAVYTPLYTKSLLFNKHIVRGEVSFVAGAGGAHFHKTGTRALVSLGFYLRFFSSERNSWKFDFRNNIYFEKSLGAVNAMSLLISYSFNLGASSGPSAAEVSDDL